MYSNMPCSLYLWTTYSPVADMTGEEPAAGWKTKRTRNKETNNKQEISKSGWILASKISITLFQ